MSKKENAPHKIEELPSMEAFFTREKSNSGIDVPIPLPTGAPSGHTLRIRGTDSDAFKTAEARANQKALRMRKENKTADELTEELIVSTRELVASLVISWTLKEACTPDNVIKLFRNAPQIMEVVNVMATRRELFFNNGSPTFPDTPKPDSN